MLKSHSVIIETHNRGVKDHFFESIWDSSVAQESNNVYIRIKEETV